MPQPPDAPSGAEEASATPKERQSRPRAAATGAPGDPSDGAFEDPLEERVVASRLVHRGRYLSLRVDTIERADGSRGEREIVGHPGAVAVVAVDRAERIALVRQFRLAAGTSLLEIPAGTLDVDEAGLVEDPDEAARRELEEETGLRARSWRRLGAFWTAPGFATERMHLYLATDLEVAADRLGPDADERLEVVWLPYAEALEAALAGEISDAKSLVGIFWYGWLRDEEAGAADEAG